MDAVFALALVRAFTQGNWNFTPLDLWSMTPKQANTPTTYQLPTHSTLFLQSFIGSGYSGDSGNTLFLTQCLLLLFDGFDQQLTLPYIRTDGHSPYITSQFKPRVQVTSNSITITSPVIGPTFNLIGSIIAIT